MVTILHLEQNIRAMFSSIWHSKWIIYTVFVLLIIEKSFSKNTGDVDDDEDTIDNIKRFYYDESLVPPHLDLDGFRKNKQHKAMVEKIEFAVTPRDYRFHVPASYLRGEPVDHSNGILDPDYNYPLHTDDFIPPNPPYFSPYAYNGKFHAKHIPFVDYNQDYRLSPALNPAVAGQYPPFQQYHDGDGQPIHDYAYKEIVDSPHLNPGAVAHAQQHHELRTSRPDHFRQNDLNVPESSYLYHDQTERRGEALSDFYFVATVAGCTVAAITIIVGAGICYYRLSKSKREAADAEYPAYGVTGPSKDVSPGAADRKLAQSAHMYHYQHQKQQMIAIEKSSSDDRHCSASDVDSEEDEEVTDYTVFECPGLAPTDNMEVKNPLFSDDPTPASPATNTDSNLKAVIERD